MTYLDTHVALWLCTGEIPLSPAALRALEDPDLRLSPIIPLEMRFLKEIGRVNPSPDDWMAILRRDFGVAICPIPFHQVIENSFNLDWSRDPFDRLIVAQAKAAAGRLITKDSRILENFDGALW